MMLLKRQFASFKYLLTFIAFSFVLFSCSKKEEVHIKDSVTVTLQRAEAAASDVAQFVKIASNGTWAATVEFPAGTETWCKLSPTSGTGNATLTLTYTVNYSNDKRDATIKVIQGTETAQVVFTQLGADSYPNRYCELPVIPANTATVKTASHYATINGGKARNYTLNFDLSNKIANWVAYPLSKDYLGSAQRKNDFRVDPLFPASSQINATLPGYDRGHQLPSADRTGNAELNSQTFYYSNMTPQLGGFNQKIWADMENKVRSYANSCDTLYVVTGAVLKTVGGLESVSYTNDRIGIQKIAVPNYYYKVLVGVKSSGATKTYKGIGFWFEHKANSGKVNSSYACSIDEIERKTGLDFFANLPKDVELAVESSYKPNEWGL